MSPAAAFLFAAAAVGPQFGEPAPAPGTPEAWVKEAADLREDDDAAAADLFLRVLGEKPEAMADELWAFRRVMEAVGRGPEHLALLAEVPPGRWGGDASGRGGFGRVLTHFENAFREHPAETSAALHAIWDAYPAWRPAVLDAMNDERFWRDPTFFAAGADRLVAAPPPPVPELLAANLHARAGQERGWLAELLDAADATGRTPALTARLAARAADRPGWGGGPLVLAALAARRGEPGEIEALLGEPLEARLARLSGDEAWAFGTLLGESDAAAPAALLAQRRAVAATAAEAEARLRKRKEDAARFGRPFVPDLFMRDDPAGLDGPRRRLVALLARTGRLAEARAVIGAAEAAVPGGADAYAETGGRFGRSASTAASRDRRRLADLARVYLDSGLPVDAARVARRAANDPVIAAALAEDRYAGFGGSELQQAERIILEAREATAPDDAAAYLRLASADGPPDLAVWVTDGGSGDGYSTRFLPEGLAGAGIGSPALDALAGPGAADARSRARETLRALAERRAPGSASDAARVILAAADGDAAALAEPLARLNRAAENWTRAPADAWAAWFLAASAAAAFPEHADAAAALTDAAFAAVGRLPDPGRGAATVALLMETGRDALARGDRAAAESAWAELGERLLDRPLPPPGGAVPAGAAAGDPRSPFNDATRERFALELAQLAADAGLGELSLRLARAALAVPPRTGRRLYRQVAAGSLLTPSGDTGGDRRRASGFVFDASRGAGDLPAKWDAAGVDAAASAGLLLDLALPPDRPGEAGESIVVDAALLDRLGPAGLRGEFDRRLARLPGEGPRAAGANATRVRAALFDGDADAAADRLAALREGLELPEDRRADPPAAVARAASSAGYAATEALDARLAADAAFATLADAVAVEEAGERPDASLLRRLAAERFARARDGRPGGDAAEAVRLVLAAADANVSGMRSSERVMARHRGTVLEDAVARLAAADLPAAADAALTAAAEWADLPPDRRSGDVETAGGPTAFAADLNRAAAVLPPAERFDRLRAWTFPEDIPGGGTLRAAVAPRPGFGAPASVPGYLFFGPPPRGDRPVPADPVEGLADVLGRPVPPLTGTLVALAAAARGTGRTDEVAAALASLDAFAGLPAAGEDWPTDVPGADRRGRDRAAIDAATLALLAGVPLSGGDLAAALAAADRRRSSAPAGQGNPSESEVEPERHAVRDAAAGLLLAWAAGDAGTELLTRYAAWCREPGRAAAAVRPFAADLIGEPIPDPPAEK